MTLSLMIWDVQHGSAAYLRTPNNRHIAIDLGTGRLGDRGHVFSPLRALRENYGVSSLDRVIITHPHRDHLDDIWELNAMPPGVLQRPRHLSPADVLAESHPGDDAVLDRYLELDALYVAPVDAANDLAPAENYGGAEILTFSPTGCGRSNLNNHSIVTFVRYASSTILVPGDNEAVSWRELLATSGFRECLATVDVLVAPHHGREAGYCADLFEVCSPSLVVVSDGPVGDTDAVHLYGRHADSWPVRSRSTGRFEDRRVLTTRCDGVVHVQLYWTPEGQAIRDVSCR
jgi:beta-lactamase superfamily II metal-dependent hydrolase